FGPAGADKSLDGWTPRNLMRQEMRKPRKAGPRSSLIPMVMENGMNMYNPIVLWTQQRTSGYHKVFMPLPLRRTVRYGDLLWDILERSSGWSRDPTLLKLPWWNITNFPWMMQASLWKASLRGEWTSTGTA